MRRRPGWAAHLKSVDPRSWPPAAGRKESRVECDEDEFAGSFHGECASRDLTGIHGLAVLSWPDKDLSAGWHVRMDPSGSAADRSNVQVARSHWSMRFLPAPVHSSCPS